MNTVDIIFLIVFVIYFITIVVNSESFEQFLGVMVTISVGIGILYAFVHLAVKYW